MNRSRSSDLGIEPSRGRHEQNEVVNHGDLFRTIIQGTNHISKREVGIRVVDPPR